MAVGGRRGTLLHPGALKYVTCHVQNSVKWRVESHCLARLFHRTNSCAVAGHGRGSEPPPCRVPPRQLAIPSLFKGYSRGCGRSARAPHERAALCVRRVHTALPYAPQVDRLLRLGRVSIALSAAAPCSYLLLLLVLNCCCSVFFRLVVL